MAWGFQPTWHGWAPQWVALTTQPGQNRWLTSCRKTWLELYQNGDAVGSREVELVYSQLGGTPLAATLAARIMNDFIRTMPVA